MPRHPPLRPRSAPTVAPADDLVTVPPDRRIDFDGAADRRIGQVLAAVRGDAASRAAPAASGPTSPETSINCTVSSRAPARRRPGSLDVRIDSSVYRTVSGVGVGTSLATLQRIYGDLVLDRADGWESPTGGLLASYSDVAAIRSGDRAITFVLRDDVVTTVKVSVAEGLG